MRDAELRALEQAALSGGTADKAQYARALARVGREGEALALVVDAIRDAPADETLALAAACLLDGGDVARAELARLEVAAASLPERDPGREALELRARGLALRHASRWLEPLGVSPARVKDQRFGRGGLTQVSVSASSFARAPGEVFSLHPISRARVVYPTDERRVLAESENLRPLRELAIETDPAELGSVLGSRHLGRLEGLSLAGSSPPEALLAVVESSPVAPRLRALEIEAPLGRTQLRALLRSPRLAGLRRLRVRTSVLGSELEQVLEGSTLELEELDLRGLLSDEGTAAIAAWPGARSLARLTLRNHRIWEAGARALADSPHLARLESLDLLDNSLGDRGVVALATSPGLAGARLALDTRRLGRRALGALLERERPLDHLAVQIDDAHFTADVLRWFVESPPAARIRSLEVDVKPAHARPALEAIAGSQALRGLESLAVRGETSRPGAAGIGLALARAGLPALRALRLAHLGLASEDVERLAEWPGLTRLVRLDLQGNRFADRGGGIASLVGAVGPDLVDLGLADVRLLPPAVLALARSRAARSLVRVDLSRNPLRAEGAENLLAWPEDSPLRFLDLATTEIDDAGGEALAAWRRLPELAQLRLVETNLREHAVTLYDEGEPWTTLEATPAAHALRAVLGERLEL